MRWPSRPARPTKRSADSAPHSALRSPPSLERPHPHVSEVFCRAGRGPCVLRRSACAEHRHRQRQTGAQSARRCADAAGHARRPAAGHAGDGNARQGRSRRARNLCARSREARLGLQRRVPPADGTGAPDAADPHAVHRVPEEEPDHRRRSAGRVRQGQGARRRRRRHRVPRAPHPGREGRRSRQADRVDQGRRQVRRHRQRRAARTPARRKTAATSTSPSPTPMCPNSARP